MWANAQRDGRPAEYRWRPLFNAASLADAHTRVQCSNADKTRNRFKFAGVPKLANRSQRLVGRSLPYCEDMRGRHCCLTIFPIVDTYLSCEDIGLVPQIWYDGAQMAIFGDFWGPVFPASTSQHISDLHSKFALGPHHV